MSSTKGLSEVDAWYIQQIHGSVLMVLMGMVWDFGVHIHAHERIN